MDRAKQTVPHHFLDLPSFLGSNDILIRNNAAVLPARLHAVRPTGGAVECFLLRPETSLSSTEQWWCLLRPGKRLGINATFARPNGFNATVLRKEDDGVALVAFQSTRSGETMTAVANRCGKMPLPLTITRDKIDARAGQDLNRYQTVYADRARQVAVAAPTAGLHFTPCEHRSNHRPRYPPRGLRTADLHSAHYPRFLPSTYRRRHHIGSSHRGLCPKKPGPAGSTLPG